MKCSIVMNHKFKTTNQLMKAIAKILSITTHNAYKYLQILGYIGRYIINTVILHFY